MIRKLPARRLWLIGLLGFALLPVLMTSCQHQCGLLGVLGCPDGDMCHDHSEVSRNPTIRALAHDMDELESHIEKYGSVVAQAPDVWGQARLTKHRDEFEHQMAKELTNFQLTLQASIARSDQAYFVDATALSNAASGSAVSPPGIASTFATGTSTSTNLFDAFNGGSSTTPGLTRTPVSQTTATQITGPTNSFNTASAYNTASGINVEPNVYLDEKKEFLNHLNEIRRINEGDDTADSPGYSLNLVRIPVSVLPGKRTDVGFGAEVTMTLKPFLGEDLLPITFRNLVQNDLVQQISFPVTQFINNCNNKDYLNPANFGDLLALIQFVDKYSIDQMALLPDVHEQLKQLRWKVGLKDFFSTKSHPEWAWVDQLLAETPDGWAMKNVHDVAHLSGIKALKSQHDQAVMVASLVSVSKARRAQLPFPASQMLSVYGYELTFALVIEAAALKNEAFSKPCPADTPNTANIHMPDVQGFLQEELGAAYNLLAHSGNYDLWNHCTPQLAQAVRAQNNDLIKHLRDDFANHLKLKIASTQRQVRPAAIALAWATIVESALLNEHLVQDMKEAATSKGVPPPSFVWHPYFLPEPTPESRQAFNNYVSIRWPLHVFALDPTTQQQNVQDTFSSRREMQLALSLAFVGGQIGASNMTRYARRIELDAATIDLNGTSIGFSHGEDTFGWRFYPRFQTPDIESNATVFFRDLLWGGPSKNALLRQRRLEPGIRECVAIVIMPSFVPYCTLNVSSNWFSLTNPKCKLMDSTYAMRLSKAVKSIENGAPTVVDAECYRDGDMVRLVEKARQLETRLPLQSTMVQVPYENTLGGFGMFNTGVTDLAPELTGWYGSPTINPTCETTIFLVGNHFSVHGTTVIAGGQQISCREMLSRQVMKVVIPRGTIQTGGDGCQKFVDIHVATPYGVTPHLLVPVCNSGYPQCNPPPPCCSSPCATPCTSTTVTTTTCPAPTPPAPTPPATPAPCPPPAPKKTTATSAIPAASASVAGTEAPPPPLALPAGVPDGGASPTVPASPVVSVSVTPASWQSANVDSPTLGLPPPPTNRVE